VSAALTSQNSVGWTRPILIDTLIVAVVIMLVALLLGLAPIIAIVGAIALAALLSLALLLSSDSIVRSMTGARRADPEFHARLYNQVEALCLAHGVVEPSLYVITDDAPSAMAFGWRLDRPSIVVSTGLAEHLQLVELEAVAAHLLSRIRRGDTRMDTVVTVFVALPLKPFGSLADRAAARFLAPQAEIQADMDGVRMTRYPPGLIKALVTIESVEPQLQSPARAIRHMWIHEKSPARAGEWPASLEDRIDILREL
jgi:Zn-dependent protease with chaperone function